MKIVIALILTLSASYSFADAEGLSKAKVCELMKKESNKMIDQKLQVMKVILEANN